MHTGSALWAKLLSLSSPVALAVLSFLLLVSVPSAAQQPTQRTHAIETIRVIQGSNDQQSAEGRRRLENVTNVLIAAGLTVVNKEDADAMLSINWGDMSVSFSPAPNWAPMGTTHHVGVKMNGSFSLTSKASTLYSGSFEGVNSCFVNIADKNALAACLDKTESLANVGAKLEGMVTELWPHRGALLALTRTASEADRAKAIEELNQRLASPEGSSLVAPLVNMLRATSPTLRQTAMRAIVELKDPRTVDLLLRALEDPDPALQGGAATVLGQLGDRRAALPLIQLLRSGSPEIQERAAEALGSLGVADAVEPLIKSLEDGSPGVQVAAAKALGRLKDPRGRQSLLAALEKGQPDLRPAAAMGLGELADSAAVAPLISALRDESAETRAAAAIALGKIGDKAAVEPLLARLGDTSADVRAASAIGLGRLSGGGPQLVPLLNDSSPKVRAAAAESLGQIALPEAVKPLAKVLDKDKDVSVRIAAAKALGRFETEEATKALNKAMKDRSTEVREAVSRSLKKTGGR
jgi:HEAT repeat protein